MRGIRILCTTTATTATTADFRLSSDDVSSLFTIDVYCADTC